MSGQISFEIQKVAYNTAFIWLKKKYYRENDGVYIHRSFTNGNFIMVASDIRFGNRTPKDLQYEFSIDEMTKSITVVSKVLVYSSNGQSVKSYNDTHDVGVTIPFIYDVNDCNDNPNMLSTRAMRDIETHIRAYINDELKDYDPSIRILTSNSNVDSATYFVRVTYTDNNSDDITLPIQYEFGYYVNKDTVTCTRISKFVVDDMYIHTVRQ